MNFGASNSFLHLDDPNPSDLVSAAPGFNCQFCQNHILLDFAFGYIWKLMFRIIVEIFCFQK